MGIKYVKDFEFPASAGFRDSAMPAKVRASERGMPAAAKKGVAKFKRGGPTTREATGPTSGRATYIPNPFGKSIKVYLGPTGGSQPRVPTKNPRDIFGNENPFYSDYETPEMEQERYRRPENAPSIEYAKGGKVSKVGKVMREYKAGKLHSGKDGKVVKNPKQAMAIALSEARKSGEKVKKLARGGPTTREATGPTSGRATYIPNPFGKSIKVYLGPTGGNQPRVSTRNPRDIFGNENPDFNQAMREAEEARQREIREGTQYARGGRVAKRANGGMMSKGPSTRGTPAKGRAQGRMEFAEKYAPGLSLDMPGKRVKKK